MSKGQCPVTLLCLDPTRTFQIELHKLDTKYSIQESMGVGDTLCSNHYSYNAVTPKEQQNVSFLKIVSFSEIIFLFLEWH